MKYLTPSLPNFRTKIVSMFSILCFLLAFGVAGYEVSYKKNHINKKDFTISQSLAFGNDPALVTLFTIGMMAYIYLIFLRGPSKYLYSRTICLLISYSLLITIIWITTYKDLKLHKIFASIIFISILIYHILTLVAFKNVSNNLHYSLLIATILNAMVLIASGLTAFYEEMVAFASLENTTVVIMGSVLLLLGFIN